MAAITTALISAGVAAAGLGMQAYGMSQQMSGAKQAAAASQAIAADEIQQDALRRQAMELSAARQEKEILRNQQRARALALNATVNQGGQTGNSTSALGGAVGQISGQTTTNQVGLEQNLALGRSMFDINNDVNRQKMLMAQAGATSAMGQGFSSLGGSLLGASGAAGNVGATAWGGASSLFNFYSKPGLIG